MVMGWKDRLLWTFYFFTSVAACLVLVPLLLLYAALALLFAVTMAAVTVGILAWKAAKP